MRIQIINVDIVLSDKIIENGVCAFTDGVIDYVGIEPQKADKTIDGNGGYLLAGFIDIHCHGGNGDDFMDATPEQYKNIADFHLSFGTTTMLATTLTAPMEETEQSLKNYEIYKKANPDGTLIGIHMEGPWFSPEEAGAQVPEFFIKPTAKHIRELKEKYPFILRASCAPEIDENFEFGKECARLGIIACPAHTGATFEIIERAKDNGYSLMTHLYSGMKGVFRKNAYRTAGAVEAGLYFDELYVEIIADGKHLPKELLKFIYKCKGSDKICLITDGTRASGYPDGKESFTGSVKNGAKCIVENGVAFLPDKQSFAGSVATTDRLVRVMVKQAEIPLTEVSKMASKTPAKVLGLSDRGEIKQGLKADFVIMDKDLSVQNVIHNGNVVK